MSGVEARVQQADNAYYSLLDEMRVHLSRARTEGRWDGFSVPRAIDYLHGLARYSIGELIEVASDAAFAEVTEPTDLH